MYSGAWGLCKLFYPVGENKREREKPSRDTSLSTSLHSVPGRPLSFPELNQVFLSLALPYWTSRNASQPARPPYRPGRSRPSCRRRPGRSISSLGRSRTNLGAFALVVCWTSSSSSSLSVRSHFSAQLRSTDPSADIAADFDSIDRPTDRPDISSYSSRFAAAAVVCSFVRSLDHVRSVRPECVRESVRQSTQSAVHNYSYRWLYRPIRLGWLFVSRWRRSSDGLIDWSLLMLLLLSSSSSSSLSVFV